MPAMFRGARVFVLAALMAASPALAASGLSPGGKAKVQGITDGDTLTVRITEAAKATPDVAKPGTEIQIRLVGIQAPKLPLGRKGFKAWPLADESKAALVELTQGKTLTLAFGGQPIDRHGRLLAQLYDADGAWIQGEMLKRGMARVYTFPDNRKLAAEMLALEGEARAAKAGIWADPYYAIRTPEEAARDIGTFQLVEGLVTNAATVRSRTYLNFGADWRTDFTIVIRASARKMLAKSGIDITSLKGRRVRIRGWIDSYNGPMIELTHPEQIEVLDP